MKPRVVTYGLGLAVVLALLSGCGRGATGSLRPATWPSLYAPLAAADWDTRVSTRPRAAGDDQAWGLFGMGVDHASLVVSGGVHGGSGHITSRVSATKRGELELHRHEVANGPGPAMLNLLIDHPTTVAIPDSALRAVVRPARHSAFAGAASAVDAFGLIPGVGGFELSLACQLLYARHLTNVTIVGPTDGSAIVTDQTPPAWNPIGGTSAQRAANAARTPVTLRTAEPEEPSRSQPRPC